MWKANKCCPLFILVCNTSITNARFQLDLLFHTIGQSLEFSEINRIHLALEKFLGNSGPHKINIFLSFFIKFNDLICREAKLDLITLNRTLLSSYGNFRTYKQDKTLEFIICKYNLNILLD